MQDPILSEFDRDLPGDRLASLLPYYQDIHPLEHSSIAEIPWTTTDWLDQVKIWIHRSIAPEGLRAIAPLEIVKVWALAIILRINTTGGLVYFKAAAPLFSHESESTRILAELYPNHLPKVVATNLDRNWILMREVNGELLENNRDLSQWQAALYNWAKFQLNTCENRARLIQLGLLDLGVEQMTKQLGHLVSQNMAQVWLRGNRFPKLNLCEILPFVPKLYAVGRQLARLNIPNTLVHGDLSPRNIYIYDREFVYFDWSDTCISHPFFDLTRFLYEIEKDLPHVPDARSRIRNAYLEAWTSYAPMEQLVATFERVSETLGSLYEMIRDRLLRDDRELQNHWQWQTDIPVPFYLQRLLIQVETYLHFSQRY